MRHGINLFLAVIVVLIMMDLLAPQNKESTAVNHFFQSRPWKKLQTVRFAAGHQIYRDAHHWYLRRENQRIPVTKDKIQTWIDNLLNLPIPNLKPLAETPRSYGFSEQPQIHFQFANQDFHFSTGNYVPGRSDLQYGRIDDQFFTFSSLRKSNFVWPAQKFLERSPLSMPWKRLELMATPKGFPEGLGQLQSEMKTLHAGIYSLRPFLDQLRSINATPVLSPSIPSRCVPMLTIDGRMHCSASEGLIDTELGIHYTLSPNLKDLFLHWNTYLFSRSFESYFPGVSDNFEELNLCGTQIRPSQSLSRKMLERIQRVPLKPMSPKPMQTKCRLTYKSGAIHKSYRAERQGSRIRFQPHPELQLQFYLP